MANEIKVTPSIVYANGQDTFTYQPGTLQLPQATQGMHIQTVTATSAEAAVTFTGITTKGWTILQSLYPTTTGTNVDYGVTSTTGGMGTPFGTLRPKEAHVLRMNTTSTLRVKNEGAAAGNVKLKVIVFNH